MAATEHPMQSLANYLSESSFDLIVKYLHQYKVHLTVTRERKTVLGDYRNPFYGTNHRISINGNLNKFSFLITLIHELAHLLTFERFGHKVQPHGKEWKQLYASLLRGFTKEKIFPDNISHALQKSFDNPAASSCADADLMRVLLKYDKKKENMFLLEELQTGDKFILKDGRIFIRGEKLRKRYQCAEINKKQVYLFSPVYEVKKI